MLRRLFRVYHITIYREDFEPRRHYSLHPWKVLVVVVFLAGLIAGGTAALIAYTSLREFIPGYPALKTRRQVLALMRTTDSLQEIINRQMVYLDAMQRTLYDHSPFSDTDQKTLDTVLPVEEIGPDALAPTDVEVEFRQSYEASFLSFPRQGERNGSYLTFLPPVSWGYQTADFDPSIRHFAIDIATPEGELIRAVAPGRVVFRGLTPEFGHVVMIQHQGGLVSIFKHCASVFPEVGTFVHAGMPVAMVGSTGELSTGPHLHFEMWMNGVPLDPSDFIKLRSNVWQEKE